MSIHCPSDEQLQAFAVGDLSGPVFQRIAEHVAECPACTASLEQLDSYADFLVTELKGLHECDGAEDPVPPHVLSGAKQAGRSPGSSDLSLDPGRRLARQLAEGPCRLGRFELQARLGDGSFGYVFKALDSELDRTVAVKIQRAGSFASDEEVRRFLREARSAAQLHHPRIVALYDSGQTEDGVCYLVSEYIEGDTLEERIGADRPEPRQAAELVAELAETLQYAHDEGVVHRDVKPSNVILDGEGHPHITDFGLAKRLADELTMTSDGRVMGTPAYMSPEQARGESHQVDARSDVYSLGVMLYELLTGERPFQGARRLLLLQVLEDEPRPPRQLDDNVPADLETICLKAMAKSPARRYQTAQELADDLQRFLAGEPIQARPVGYAERLWRWCRRNPLAASLLLAVSLGSAIGFGYLSYLTTHFVRETALDSARLEAEMLETITDYYSEQIVDRMDLKDVKEVSISHIYATKRNVLPIPRSFMIDAGEWISRGTSGMRVAVFSPFPWRKDAPQKDGFQLRAMRDLALFAGQDAEELSIHEFTERDGRPVIRYAKGQVMKESCIKCHNNNKQSPKRDWKPGDLAGVLEVTRPLDRAMARTRSGLNSALVLTGSIAVALVGLSFTLLLRSGLKGRS